MTDEARPLLGAFVVSYPHIEYIFVAVQVYRYCYVYGFLYYLAFASDVVVHDVKIDYCIRLVQEDATAIPLPMAVFCRLCGLL